ncbi:hypothetical protein AMS68_001343 [Peltaster fructicola]|uniref:Cleavage/polyadenylation specificity factor A subunit C-terminal domain-containing protein n=1 Tax=Peltaster fructicola TaxID=286661 RepID=A0A6H0XM93_9PEZI|nr:hypothetical protein AMS68_001343 [Peltaster fructicola]
MQCYSELLPPTAVTDALALNFIQQGRLDLVVAKTSLLQVFKVQHAKDSASARLLLIGEYQLSGTITSLQQIHTQDDKSGIDSLLIGFRDAKVSLVRWDHDNHRISTVSIHYYETDPVPRQPCDIGAGYTTSILTVDPSSRCVALKFDQRQLAILPFRQAGEDAELEDMDDEDKKKVVRNGTTVDTPYKKSFVLSLPSLDQSLTDVVDLAFLHDYREPTFGILASAGQASSALWSEGKDILTYHVLTLDLEQGASTILVSVPMLPASLWKVKPLPSPIGGALLLGTNELVHVSQSGKTHALVVNEFADMAGFTTTDQRSLDLKLEDCVVEVLDAEALDVLFALRDGSLATLHFNMLGSEVKSMSFNVITAEAGGSLCEGLPSCVARLHDFVFVGSDEADSVLLRSHSSSNSRKRSHAEMMGQQAEDEAKEEDDEDEDDLYATTTRQTRSSTKTSSQVKSVVTYSFEVSDTLQGLGPMSKPCFGKSSGGLELATITGRSRGSRLALLSRELRPIPQRSHQVGEAKAVWSLRCVKPKKKRQPPLPGPDNFLFVFDGSSTKVFEAPQEEGELVEISNTEFEQDGDTIEIGTLGSGRWIVHCRKSEIRTYEPDLSLGQIIPMLDEASDAELDIVHTQFCDPYLLVVRSDNTPQVLAFDQKSEDIEALEGVVERKCIGGSLYRGPFTSGDVAAFLLLDDGSLQVLSLPDLTPVYTSLNLPSLPPILSADSTQKRPGFKETLTEMLVADIGIQGFAQPYLILRTSADDLIFYEPFSLGHTAWTDKLRFRKVPVQYLPKYDEYMEETDRVSPLRPITIDNYVAVVVPGRPPCLIMSETSSRPKVLRIDDNEAVYLTAVQQSTLVTLSTGGVITHSVLPSTTCVGTGWTAQKLHIGDDELRYVAYHEAGGMYVLATCKQVDFLFPEEDTRHQDQDDITSRPTVPQYSLHLFSASTHRIINTYEFPPGEAIACLEIMPLDTSEHTHEVKQLVSVGTALLRGEDMPTKGALVLLELQPVIPEPDDDETGVKLHVLSREHVKGAVTTTAPFIGGLIGVSQGQKIMVRGMKEDGSCLPVAFLDCQCQLNTLKTLWRTGLWLAGDSWKGLWMGGFTEDPYKLTFLGKSQTMEVLCAEFLPFESQLFVLAIDAEMDLHVLQYDPEDPKTVSGARLLHRATFNTGHWPTSMTLVPSTLSPWNESETEGEPLYHILITTQSGAIHLLTPLDNAAYRRLGNIYGQMASILEHPAALNPREYRAADGDVAATKGVIDGTLIQRVGELGSAKRAEVLSRCGSDAWMLRSDLKVICGGGLAWL